MTPRRALAVALAVLLAGPVAVRGQESEEPAALLAEGEAAYEVGDYELARERLWTYLDRTGDVTGPSRLPQARALYLIGLMEPDAAVAGRHYQTILEEYPAATEASSAAHRLGVLALVEGRPDAAREWFRTLGEAYPFSRMQPELPLWVGRTYLEEGRYVDATDAFLDGYTKVKTQDLPTELPVAQREALAAEYAWWLARAFREEGDLRTAQQYYSLLVLDYPGSPQAEDARAALEAIDEGDVAERPTGREVETIARAEPPPEEEPSREPEPPIVRTAPDPDVEPGEAELDDDPDPEDHDAGVARAPSPAPAAAVGGEARDVEERPAEERIGVEPEARPDDEAGTPEVRPADDEAGTPEVRPAGDEPAARPRERRADVGPAALARAPAQSGLFLQIGAFTSASRAADLSRRLKADGFDAKIEIGVVDGQGYYRVRVGPFRMPEEEELVEANRRRLEARGYPADTVRGER